MTKKLLIITLNWPAPNYSAAGIRIFQLIDFFKRRGYSITVASTADKQNDNEYHDVETVKILLNHSSFNDFVLWLNPDIVLFDRFMAEEQFGWRIAENVPKAMRILDTEDLHSLRKSRAEALKKDILWSENLWLQSDITKREIASIYRSDLSLIISSYEMKLLENVIDNKSILLHLPFMIKGLSDSQVEKWISFRDKQDFVFIGFGGHSPNVDAIFHLKKDIWPLIRAALPEAKVNIYGGNFSEKVHQMHDPKQGFFIKGWVKNSEQVISNARVMLAPLRFGAGLKGKLVDAMQFGTPSVTTSIGAEGMHDNLPWNGKICDDPKTFAQAAIELYQNKGEWEQSRKNAMAIINQIYDGKTLDSVLSSTITSLQENLHTHRNTNFIGQLLEHQTLASTKYMSKWITEKNRHD